MVIWRDYHVHGTEIKAITAHESKAPLRDRFRQDADMVRNIKPSIAPVNRCFRASLRINLGREEFLLPMTVIRSSIFFGIYSWNRHGDMRTESSISSRSTSLTMVVDT